MRKSIDRAFKQHICNLADIKAIHSYLPDVKVLEINGKIVISSFPYLLFSTLLDAKQFVIRSFKGLSQGK